MKIVIEDRYLSDVADLNKLPGKSPYPAGVVERFKERLALIRQMASTSDLRKFASFHFEKLKEKKYDGKYSIRLNKAYRLIFRIENEEISKVEIICIEEINNHYS